IVATATDLTDGTTSEFSPCTPFQLHPVVNADVEVRTTAPASAVAGSDVDVYIDAINHGPADAALVSIRGSTYAGATIVSNEVIDGDGICYGTIVCDISLLRVGQRARIRQRMRITAQPGATVSHFANASAQNPDPDLTNNRVTTPIAVTAGTPVQDV